jgi:hypothetical protein
MDGWWDCDDLAGMFRRLFESRQFIAVQARNPRIMASGLLARVIPEGSWTPVKTSPLAPECDSLR